MKFWERFLNSIFKHAAKSRIQRVKSKLLEPVLANSLRMLDEAMVEEIRSFIISKQNPDGGFSDRGGKSDLYYTLFGSFIAEAFSVAEVRQPLTDFIARCVKSTELSGVYRYCGAIMYARLNGPDEHTEKLRKQIVSDLTKKDSKQPEYSNFLGVLALYYVEDFINIQRIINQYKRSDVKTRDLPCPVVAATSILLAMAGNSQPEVVHELKSFFRENGGFAAVRHAPTEDVLSTGVALFALHFLEADLRLIKPDCLIFVDGLYDDGGFRSTSADSMTDVEYTFYGLLALGSLN